MSAPDDGVVPGVMALLDPLAAGVGWDAMTDLMPPDEPVDLSPAELAAAVAAEEAAGASRKDAIRAVVVRTGLPRRAVYDAVVAAKNA